jgi:lysophospholipase L1-like esterase
MTSRETCLQWLNWRAHGIRVVLCPVMQVHSYTDTAKDLSAQRLQSRILALNGWIKAFALKSNLVYVDYFSALVDDDQGLMKKELADDGLHPNAAGYKIAAPVVQAGIEKALR